MATNYHLSNIRALLTDGFTPDELRRFCYDTSEFRAVYDELAGETGKAKIIDLLLEHAERKGHLDLLLAWAKTESQAQYAAHEPYLLDRRPIRQAQGKPPTHSAGSGQATDRQTEDSPSSPLASSPHPSSPPSSLASSPHPSSPPSSPASSPHPSSPPSSFASSPPASSRPLRVFLCHASADKPAVRDLYQRLSQEGFIQPWLDEEELLPGQDWQREIPQAVRASDVVLVCLSSQSVTKAGYVQKEIKFALDVADEQPEGTIFLIPVRLEACDVPERLQRWHWANLFETKGYERLLKALRRRAEAPPPVIPSASEESSPPVALKSAEANTPPPTRRETPHFVRSDMETTSVIPSASEESSPPAPNPSPAKRETPHFVRGDMPTESPISNLPSSSFTITKPIRLELIRIPAGEFLMGSDPAKDKDARENEQPQHRVYVSEFFIGKYPITNEQYAVFVRAAKHQEPDHWGKGKIPTGKENHPVVYISWDDATAFCQWLSQASGQSFRLPTEAEWEKAARGTDGRIYPWGNQWDKSKLNNDSGTGGTTPVGRYSPEGDSPYGVADMVGNVWEWCADWFAEKEYQQRAKTVVKDPTGPDWGQYRVLRGGAFNDEASWSRGSARCWRVRYGFGGFGMRVVGGGPFFSEALKP